MAETTEQASAAAEAAQSNGADAAGRATIEVENPATGEIIGSVPKMGPEEVAGLVERARAAQPGWEAMGFDARARVLKRAQRWLIDNADRVVDTIVKETGKTYEDAQIAEIGYGAQAFGFWADNAPKFLAEERLKSSSPFGKGKKLVVRYRPVGVVGVIGPWNYPFSNSVGDCIPALAAGNAVVMKPSEVTPLTSLLMAEAFAECGLPEDVYLVATGEGDAGAALIDHVDFVMFTGSTATGKKVMARAAETLTPVGLELGGKDPMIVLSDANLERASNAAAYYSMQNGGQTCISVERVYVEEPVYDEFVSKVTEKVGELRQGVPGGPGSVDVGAVTFGPQIETIDSHVKDALEKGARVVTGGKPGNGPGRFYEPTVLLDVDHSMECMTEETFGPTLPIMKVRDAEEAVRLANDSPYGLQASVWTRDTTKGERIAQKLQAGVANVNEHQISYTTMELPMGGWKASGMGTRHGPDGIRKYTKKQASMITRIAPSRELFMFPYKKRNTRIISGLVKLVWGRGKR